jgi:crotonobetainyl-CoA:carnitine CoA-transferase CaiB-like acyl-CoA transferase
MPGLPLADLFAAMWTVAGTLAALVARHHSGEGCHLDISMLDSVSSLMAVPTAEWRASGKAPQRGKMWLTGGKACYNVYETADGGHMSLGALEPSFWRDFCQATERPEWLPRQNEADQAALIAEVAALFKMHSRDHWTRVFGAHDCCCEPVLSLEEASLHPQVQLRGLYSQGHLLTPLSRPNGASVEAPALGQHTEEILAELGLDSEEVQRLRGDGAL